MNGPKSSKYHVQKFFLQWCFSLFESRMEFSKVYTNLADLENSSMTGKVRETGTVSQKLKKIATGRLLCVICRSPRI